MLERELEESEPDQKSAADRSPLVISPEVVKKTKGNGTSSAVLKSLQKPAPLSAALPVDERKIMPDLSLVTARRVEYYVDDAASEFRGSNIKFNKISQYGLVITIKINRDFVLSQYGVEWDQSGFHVYDLFNNNSKYKKDIAEFNEKDPHAALKKLYVKHLFQKYKALKSKLFAASEADNSFDLEYLTENAVLLEYETRKTHGGLILRSDAERSAASIGINLNLERKPWDIFLATQFFRISINPKKKDSPEYLNKLLQTLVFFKIIPIDQIDPLREILGLPPSLSSDSKLPMHVELKSMTSKDELESILPKQIQESLEAFCKVHPRTPVGEILNSILSGITIKGGPKKLSELLNEKIGALTIGEKLLFWSVKNGNKNLVALLQGHGVNINIREDKEGRQPLHWAAKLENLEIVRFLLRNGAKEQKDFSGRMPAHFAARSKKHELIDEFSIASLCEPDNVRKLSLHYAAEAGASTTALTILNHDRSSFMDYKDEFGDTPMHKAAARLGTPDSEDHREYVRIIKMLLCSGHAPDKKNNAGKTPIDIARELLGASLTIRIFTPSQIPVGYGNSNKLYVEYFQDLGAGIDLPASHKVCTIS